MGMGYSMGRIDLFLPYENYLGLIVANSLFKMGQPQPLFGYSSPLQTKFRERNF